MGYLRSNFGCPKCKISRLSQSSYFRFWATIGYEYLYMDPLAIKIRLSYFRARVLVGLRCRSGWFNGLRWKYTYRNFSKCAFAPRTSAVCTALIHFMATLICFIYLLNARALWISRFPGNNCQIYITTKKPYKTSFSNMLHMRLFERLAHNYYRCGICLLCGVYILMANKAIIIIMKR